MAARRIAGLISLVAMLPGCALPARAYCDPRLTPSIVIEVRDAATGVPITGGLRGIASGEESHLEISRASAAGSVLAFDVPPGRYQLRVEHADYAPWSLADVEVRRLQCDEAVVELRAALSPRTSR